MNTVNRTELIEMARHHIPDDDRSHDFLHALRVLNLAEKIAQREGGDMDIVIPAALFHDVIVYHKDHKDSALSSVHSADWVRKLLSSLDWYPQEKVEAVASAVFKCSFSKDLVKSSLEEVIIQDADLLESMGAISIGRVFCSAGQMKKAFYSLVDPECVTRDPDPRKYALDLFPARLFKIQDRLVTKTAKRLARRRKKVMNTFYKEFIKDVGNFPYAE